LTPFDEIISYRRSNLNGIATTPRVSEATVCFHKPGFISFFPNLVIIPEEIAFDMLLKH
jgi:hypothetical protein